MDVFKESKASCSRGATHRVQHPDGLRSNASLHTLRPGLSNRIEGICSWTHRVRRLKIKWSTHASHYSCWTQCPAIGLGVFRNGVGMCMPFILSDTPANFNGTKDALVHTLPGLDTCSVKNLPSYRGTSLIRKRHLRGPYSRPMPMVLGGS